MTLPDKEPASPLTRYREYLAQGQLAYQVDTATGQAVFFPRLVAPHTGNALAWKVSSGHGTVYATTTISPRDAAPYNIVLVDMDEGYRLMSRVESVDPAQVRIGMRVQARIYHPGGDADPYPVFNPLEAP
ncbi:MAG: OB-fold domain-containing protein [Rhodoferax sp.]|nr:OB-fold domain-containing protein [Rhodoferax sp.]